MKFKVNSTLTQLKMKGGEMNEESFNYRFGFNTGS